MKKSVMRISVLALVAVILTVTLASCGGLSGTYESKVLGQGVSYTFKGNKVIIDVTVLVTLTFEGTYKIKDDKITIEIDSDSEDAAKYSGTHSFTKGDGYITIDGVKLTKKD